MHNGHGRRTSRGAGVVSSRPSGGGQSGPRGQGGPRGQSGIEREIQRNIKRQQQQKETQKQNQINENNRRRIEEMRNAQAAQDNRTIEQRQEEEKGINIYGKTTTEFGGRKATTTSAEDYYGDVQGTVDLAKRLRAAGKDQNDPDLTQEERDALERLQFSQDEGVYGGVSGYESEVNKMKKAIVEGGAGYKEALAGLTRLSGGNEELAKISALGIQEYLNRKSKGDPGAMSDIITGKTQIEGLSPEFFKNLTKQTGNLDIGTDPLGTYIGGDAMGYDPTGAYTWSDIESDPTLYDKYLNRGKNWYDPLSGLFDPPKQKYYGGPSGGGFSGWPGGGGGGGGGYGGYGPKPGYKPEQMANFYTPQANLQQAMINVHQTPTVFKKRGGIVSLLELRS